MAKKGTKRKTPNVIGFEGKHPYISDGWIKKASVNFYKTEWVIYTRFQQEDNPEKWVSVKIAAKGRTQDKANYSFGYSLAQERTQKNNGDITKMVMHRPELLAFVLRLFGWRIEVSLPAPRDERDDYWPDE